MRRHQLARDGEAKAAARRACRALVPLEDPFRIARRESCPGVHDRERHGPGVLGRSLDIDRASLGRVAQRIRDEVAEHFREAVGVRDQGGQLARVPPAKLHAGRLRGAGHRGHRVVDQVRGLDLREVERQRTGLGEGDGPKVVDQPVDEQRLVPERREVRVVARAKPIEHALEPAPDDRQRGPQLMADVGEQRPAALVRCREALGEGVQRTGSRPKLTWPALGNANLVVADREPVGGRQQVRDGGGDAPRAAAERDQQDRPNRDREDDLTRHRRRPRVDAGKAEEAGQDPGRDRGHAHDEDDDGGHQASEASAVAARPATAGHARGVPGSSCGTEGPAAMARRPRLAIRPPGGTPPEARPVGGLIAVSRTRRRDGRPIAGRNGGVDGTVRFRHPRTGSRRRGPSAGTAGVRDPARASAAGS